MTMVDASSPVPRPGTALEGLVYALGRVVSALTMGFSSRALNVLGWMLFLWTALAAYGSQAFAPVSAQDEGQLLTYPWLIAQGSVPYRANRTLTASWTRFSWLGAFVLLSLNVGPLVGVAVAWYLGLPLVLAGLVAARAHPRLSILFFFLAGTCRFEFGVAGTIALVALGILDRYGRACRRYTLRHAALLVVGLAMFYALLNLVTAGTAVRGIFLDPALLIQPRRQLPLVPTLIDQASWSLALVVFAGPLVMIAIGWVRRDAYLVATNLAMCVLFGQFLQRADNAHFLFVAYLVVPWLLIALVDLLRPEQGRPPSPAPGLPASSPHIVATLLLCGAIIGLVVLLYNGQGFRLYDTVQHFSPRALVGEHAFAVEAGTRGIIANSAAEARDDQHLIRYMLQHSTPAQRIFVGPVALRYDMYSQTVLYYVLGRKPATRYLDMEPGLERLPCSGRSCATCTTPAIRCIAGRSRRTEAHQRSLIT
jgi:hypothetical protein